MELAALPLRGSRITEVPFKESWYLHPDLKGQSSIKVVLPTLAPEMTYEGMEIAGGEAASLAFEDLFQGRTGVRVVDSKRQALLDYCRLDTMAMVTIVEKLRTLVGH